MVITSFLLCRRQVDRNCLSCHHQSSSFLRSRTFRRRRFGAGHLGASHFGAGLFGAITLILSVNFGPGSRTLPPGYYPPDITPRTLRPRTLSPRTLSSKHGKTNTNTTSSSVLFRFLLNIFISFVPL